MTRDDIYDHLAQVYLGKRKEADDKKKKQFSAWLFINIVITVIIFASIFDGTMGAVKVTLRSVINFFKNAFTIVLKGTPMLLAVSTA